MNLYGRDASGKYSWQSSWKAYSLSKEPEGLTYDNFNNTNAMWAANRDGAVQWYNGGGSAADNSKQKTDIRFAVKSTEKDSKYAEVKGIVTDGNNNLWVLFDNKDGKNDTIQRYTISRGTVNGIANTPTGLTLVNTLNLGDKLGSVTGITLDPTQGANGNLWIVSAGEGSKNKNGGIYALTGARGVSTNGNVMPTLVGALAPGNTQPQGIADPFVPETPISPQAVATPASDPIIAPSPLPSPAALDLAGAASNPPAAPPGLAPASSPSPLPLMAPGFGTSTRKKDATFFRSPQQGPGSTLSTMDLKSINTRTLMSMMTSSNYFQSHNTAHLV